MDERDSKGEVEISLNDEQTGVSRFFDLDTGLRHILAPAGIGVVFGGLWQLSLIHI